MRGGMLGGKGVERSAAGLSKQLPTCVDQLEQRTVVMIVLTRPVVVGEEFGV